MTTERPRPNRHEEIASIVAAKDGGVVETSDYVDKYTVVGAARRETFANWLTPIEAHFVCHRNDIPVVDPDTWSVGLTGAVDGSLSMATIREEYPTTTVAHTMECAGNGRGQHRPETGSVQWEFEAVATALWTGTPVAAILDDHGVSAPDDRWLTAVGGDPSTQDDVFARSIPLEKALDDCVLAYEMNGRELPREHGYPVRLIVPGWYGVNNVKWVEELRVMDSMVVDGSLDRDGDHAYWQQDAYRIHPDGATPASNDTVPTVDTWTQLEGAVEHPYTFDANVMSLIGTPSGASTVRLGSDDRWSRMEAGQFPADVDLAGVNEGSATVDDTRSSENEDPSTEHDVRSAQHDDPSTDDESITVRGVAWAGDDAVAGVEISTDGGKTWHDAELFGPTYSGAWRLFRYDWDAEPGTHVLYSRATDELGRRQPARISKPDAWDDALDEDAYPWNAGGYGANAYEPNGVTIEVLPAEDRSGSE